MARKRKNPFGIPLWMLAAGAGAAYYFFVYKKKVAPEAAKEVAEGRMTPAEAAALYGGNAKEYEKWQTGFQWRMDRSGKYQCMDMKKNKRVDPILCPGPPGAVAGLGCC